MKVIHFNSRYIQRSKGGSVIGFASYCSGERLRDERNGRFHQKKRDDVIHKEIMLPDNAPRGFSDRQTLWNSVNAVEKNSNAQQARAVEVGLPRELGRSSQITLIRDYAQRNFVDQGMCADICVHDKGDGKPHAHVLLTLRSLDSNGKWTAKTKKNYILDRSGSKIYDPVKRQYKCGRCIQINNWNDRGNVEKWRQEWAIACNRELERHGLNMRVTHKSRRTTPSRGGLNFAL